MTIANVKLRWAVDSEWREREGGAFALSHHHASVVMMSDERAMVILSAHVAIPAVSVTSKARNDVHDHMFMHTQTHTHRHTHAAQWCEACTPLKQEDVPRGERRQTVWAQENCLQRHIHTPSRGAVTPRRVMNEARTHRCMA